MARPWSLPLSALLVLAGALGAEGGAWWFQPRARWQVCLCAGLAMLISSCSFMANDYFDFVGAVDTEQTQRRRPLVKGEVTPREVKVALKRLYFLLLMGICLLEARALRVYVLVNATLAYVYTKSLKPRSFALKNGCAAGVRSLAIGLGALAAAPPGPDALGRGLAAVWPAVAAAFFGALAREVMMDVRDEEPTEASAYITAVLGPGAPGAQGWCTVGAHAKKHPACLQGALGFLGFMRLW
ncbi:unnamed protein product [Prorocentrum cordatum]|uniref:UbiA prenyltransferase domain-containing protein 1 n=1 Tax=Prorocentrum cordatum TaxID=2364126 RepID=A0ABN9Q9K6_9DINO|nr:unnamed protein product [Polarella glacialis]